MTIERCMNTKARADTGPDAADRHKLLRIASDRLQQCVGIARAAEICADIGRADDAVRVTLDLEPLLYEAKTLINAASILNRMMED